MTRIREDLSLAAKWLVAGGGPLKERTLRGAIWLVVGEVINRFSALIKMAILGRLLSPRDFGLLGIALLVQHWVESFTQTGINAALIQKREDIRPYLDTAWTFQMLRSALVATLIWFAAPFGASLFRNADAVPAIRAAGVLTLLWGCTNPAVVFLRKELDFRRDIGWRATSAIAGLITGVVLAFVLRNAWALVLSVIAARAAETAASYWIHPYRPRWKLEWQRVRELLRFGKWIFWSNLIMYFEANMDSLLTGRFLGPAALGQYQVAGQVASRPISQMGLGMHGLLFPAFSKLGSEERIRRGFLHALRILGTILVPAGVFVSLFPQMVVRLVLGPKWLPIASLMQLLAWVGIMRAFGVGFASPLFLGLGQPKWSMIGALLRLAVMAALTYPLLKLWGLTGVATALMIACACSLCYQALLIRRLIAVRARDIAGALLPAALGASAFGVGAQLAAAAPQATPVFAAAAGAVYAASVIRVLRTHLAASA